MGAFTDRTGESFVSNEGCEFKIVEYVNCKSVWIEFCDEHRAKVHTNYKACQKGNVKNPYFPSVYGVACVGLMSDGTKPKTRANGKLSREYNTWHDMVKRVYDPKFHERYPTYKDVKLDKDLHCFAYFLEHIHLIDGYEEVWLKSDVGDRVVLDKDIKQHEVENKIYSLDTVCFITNEDNVKEMMDRCGTGTKPTKVYGVNVKTGEHTKIFESISEASRELNIQINSISRCCMGDKKYKTAGGYKWYKVE